MQNTLMQQVSSVRPWTGINKVEEQEIHMKKIKFYFQ